MTRVEVVPATGLAEPLALLTESLRGGEPVSAEFVRRLRLAIRAGKLEVLVARDGGLAVGVLVLAYRLSVSAGGHFASVEDLYVRPEARRRGVGRILLEAADERCRQHRVSYVEVQVEDDAAAAFYAALGYEPEQGVRVFSRSLALPEG